MIVGGFIVKSPYEGRGKAGLPRALAQAAPRQGPNSPGGGGHGAVPAPQDRLRDAARPGEAASSGRSDRWRIYSQIPIWRPAENRTKLRHHIVQHKLFYVKNKLFLQNIYTIFNNPSIQTSDLRWSLGPGQLSHFDSFYVYYNI